MIPETAREVSQKSHNFQYSGNPESARRQRDFRSMLGMIRRVMQLGGLDHVDADTVQAIIARKPLKAGVQPLDPFKASNDSIGRKMCLGSEAGKNLKRSAQRRKRRLFNEAQPAVGRRFIDCIKGAYNKQSQTSDVSEFIDYLTPAADTALQLFRSEGLTSPEWAEAEALAEEAQRQKSEDLKRQAAILKSDIYDRYALAALNSLPKAATPAKTANLDAENAETPAPKLKLYEYTGDRVRQITQSLEKAADRIEDVYRNPSEAVAFLVEVRRTVDAQIRTRIKTNPHIAESEPLARSRAPETLSNDAEETPARGFEYAQVEGVSGSLWGDVLDAPHAEISALDLEGGG